MENEDLIREKKELEKQIFLHEELERDMKQRFEPIKEKLEVMDERIVLQVRPCLPPTIPNPDSHSLPFPSLRSCSL